MTDDSWRTASFRQNVIARINEEFCQSNPQYRRNVAEIENYVFTYADSKKRYLCILPRLLHLCELSAGQETSEISDAINALQNLAIQESSDNQIMETNDKNM